MIVSTVPSDSLSFLPRNKSTLVVWENVHGGYSYEYSYKEVALKPGETVINISLKYTKLNNGFDARIVSYLCTDKNKAKIHDLHPKPPGHVGEYKPVPPYMPGTNAIDIKFNLQDHDLVLIGIVVRITDPSGKVDPYDLICDPQVGNGPP